MTPVMIVTIVGWSILVTYLAKAVGDCVGRKIRYAITKHSLTGKYARMENGTVTYYVGGKRKSLRWSSHIDPDHELPTVQRLSTEWRRVQGIENN